MYYTLYHGEEKEIIELITPILEAPITEKLCAYYHVVQHAKKAHAQTGTTFPDLAGFVFIDISIAIWTNTEKPKEPVLLPTLERKMIN